MTTRPEVPLPGANRSFLCTKCGHTEFTFAPLGAHPSCPNCTYLGFVLCDNKFTAEQMHAYAAQVAEARCAALREALDESVKLQTHYAELLNMYDGGRRIGFASADEWIARLAALKTTP